MEAYKFEIEIRKILLKRLAYPEKLLSTAAKKEADKREARVLAARQFETLEEAREAYGWGYITAEEYTDITKALEEGDDYINNALTPIEHAHEMLKTYIARLESEIRDFKFHMLPHEEQDRIRKESEERRAHRDARRLSNG